MTRWIYTRDGEDFGPTDFGGLRHLAKSMHLHPDCLLRQVGQSERIPARSLEGLVFVEPESIHASSQGDGAGAVIDHVYLAQQRRIIVASILGGAAFLAFLAGVTIVLGILV
jgi:hypothetical protein